MKYPMNLSPDLLHPLSLFYVEAHTPLPRIEAVAPDQVPQPYHRLLVHDDDMTPTLERYYRQPLTLSVLMVHHKETAISRQVTLVTQTSRQPVEFGAIQIELAHFNAETRQAIRACRAPLGAILRDHAIPHRSRPNGFLRVWSDTLMNEALKLVESQNLYGRRNRLLTHDGRTLAQVVEILAPVKN